MAFQSGNSYGGRKRGSKNRLTNDVRQVFHKVYEEMGSNEEIVDEVSGEKRKQTGHEAMLEWARLNKSEFYKHYAKMIPATAELPEEMHEDFIGDLIFEDEQGELVETDAVDVGDVDQLQLPSGETVPDLTPHASDILKDDDTSA